MVKAERLLADKSTSITTFKKNPMASMLKADGDALVVMNRNKPAFYCVPPELFAIMLAAARRDFGRSTPQSRLSGMMEAAPTTPPFKDPTTNNGDLRSDYDYRCGWNACLNEFRRLNSPDPSENEWLLDVVEACGDENEGGHYQ